MGENQIKAQPAFAILLPETLFQYLQQVFEAHVRAGIASDELEIACELKRRLQSAQPVDFSRLGPAKVTKAAPGSIGLETLPTVEPPPDVEADKELARNSSRSVA
jgi:hypothetical protein